MSILKYIMPISSKEDSEFRQTSGNKAQVILHLSASSEPASRNSSHRDFSLNDNARMHGSKQVVKNCAYIRTGHAYNIGYELIRLNLDHNDIQTYCAHPSSKNYL